MTLFEFIKAMEAIAEAQPAINQVVPGDVYLLNGDKQAEYGVFAWQHRQHQEEIEGDYRLYSFQLFYIDRETQDGGNILQAQSMGFDVLSNIIRTIVQELGVSIYSTPLYQPFEQRFKDECAGIYATVTFIVPNETICPEEYIC
jgi:hypothetical protein